MRGVTFLTAAVAAIALGGAAFAADLPTHKGPAPAPYVAPPVAAFTWSGPYIGAFAGGNWARTTATDDTFGGVGIPAINTNGLTAGGLAGWNWGFNGFVIGAEVEAGYDHRKGGPAGYTIGVIPATQSAYGAAEGRLRGRLGWGWDRWMLFVAGGGSVTDLQVTSGLPGMGQQLTHWRGGFNIGGGLDWAFNDHWVLRGEYIYDWYGKRGYDFNGQNALFGNQTVKLQESTARAVLSYKF